MSVVLLTGATGFVGKSILLRLLETGLYSLVAVSRYPVMNLPVDDKVVLVYGDVTKEEGWTTVLKGVDVIVHAAGRAHVTNDTSLYPLNEFRKVNTQGTLNLAQQAANSGVKRFIFISSIGVNGNQSTCPFTENDIPNPAEPYAVSKLEAEQGLRLIAQESGMESVIIRPPLVYGPNAPGNFGTMMRWVQKGIPLPLGSVNYKRSFVAQDNLVDFILTCIDHPDASNQTFLVADGEDISLADLLRRIGQAIGRPTRLIPVPPGLLLLCAYLLGKGAIAQRLSRTLQVDISKSREVLGWKPPLSVDEGLRRVV
jgi:nucleoside-diphosphate-sugar epimerase